MSSQRYPNSSDAFFDRFTPTVGNTCHVNVDPTPKPPISVYTCACHRLPFSGVRNWSPTMGSNQVFEPSTLRTFSGRLMRRLVLR